MSVGRCPGQDRRYWKPGDIFEEPCPHCGGMIEFWKDDVTLRCPHCRRVVTNPRFDPGCAAWCSYASKCLGEMAAVYQHQPRVIRDKLEVEARKNLSHHRELLSLALKAASFAEKIARDEGVQPLVAIAACLFYDVEKAGENGTGSSTTRESMARAGLEPGIIEQVTKIIAAGDRDLDDPAWQVVQKARYLANKALAGRQPQK
ncbi:phage terminase large subunit family protein [Moorella sulfitireducens (nom. illeg.)]|uniref:phage terminase large subunit family protein n=1 Tax=Neomoorella sulfitireducens TaxID=2972948 RepID=UPI0021AC0813|nr:phage terminase large subunit family protein [Moorella sulfitireducens]